MRPQGDTHPSSLAQVDSTVMVPVQANPIVVTSSTLAKGKQVSNSGISSQSDILVSTVCHSSQEDSGTDRKSVV